MICEVAQLMICLVLGECCDDPFSVFDWDFAGSSGSLTTSEPSVVRVADKLADGIYATRLRDAVPSGPPSILPGPSWVPSMGSPPQHPHRIRASRIRKLSTDLATQSQLSPVTG